MKLGAFVISLPLLFVLLGLGLDNWWLAAAGTVLHFAYCPVVA